MTESDMQASEVHLFDWIKDNVAIIGSFLVVIWAMLVFWFKTITSRYLTRHEADSIVNNKIEACKLLVDKRDDELERLQRDTVSLIKDLERKIDHLDDRRREDAVQNTQAHENILTQIMHWMKEK